MIHSKHVFIHLIVYVEKVFVKAYTWEPATRLIRRVKMKHLDVCQHGRFVFMLCLNLSNYVFCLGATDAFVIQDDTCRRAWIHPCTPWRCTNMHNLRTGIRLHMTYTKCWFRTDVHISAACSDVDRQMRSPYNLQHVTEPDAQVLKVTLCTGRA